MKKTMIVMLITLISWFGTSAHDLTPVAYCSNLNQVTVLCQNFTVGKYNGQICIGKFYITKNGSQTISGTNPVIWSLSINLAAYTSAPLNDSVGQITTAGFYINVPQWVSGSNPSHVGVTVYSTENDQYGSEVWSTSSYTYTTLSSSCSVLPITFSSITATKLSNDKVRVDFVIATSTGINTINIQISFDEGKTYETRAVVFPDSALAGKVFSVTFSSKQ